MNHLNQAEELGVLPRTSTITQQILLEEFADDFDVSLSGLCLDPSDTAGSAGGGRVGLPPPGGVVVEGPNNIPITLFSQLGATLSDIVKVEGGGSAGTGGSEELNFQTTVATVLQAALANGGQGQQGLHHSQQHSQHHHSQQHSDSKDNKLSLGGGDGGAGGSSAPGTPVQHGAMQLFDAHEQ